MYIVQDIKGWTAFMTACYNGHKDIVKVSFNYVVLVPKW